MEIVIIAIVAIALGGIWYYNRNPKSFDLNQDGKVDAADAQVAVEAVKTEVKEVVAEVKVAAEKTKAVAKKTTAKVKEAAKTATTRGRKPKAK